MLVLPRYGIPCSDTGSSGSEHSFALEQRADAAPASNDSADANDGRDDSFAVPLEDVAGGGNRLGVAARPSSDSTDGEGRCAEKDQKEKKDGKTRPAVRGGQAPRLFESLLSVRVCSRTHYVLDQMLVVSSVADEAPTASDFRVLCFPPNKQDDAKRLRYQMNISSTPPLRLYVGLVA